MEIGLDTLHGWRRSGDVASLREAALDPAVDQGSRFFAARLLGSFADSETIDALIALLADDDVRLRAQAARSLRKIGPDARSAVGSLRRLLFDREGSVRVAAVRALGEIGDKSALPDIEKVADTTAWDTLHSWATESLTKLASPEASRHLIQRLSAEKAWQRRWAAEQLGAVGNTASLDAIRTARSRDRLHWRAYTRAIRAIENRTSQP